MKRTLGEFLKAILAGAVISIGCMVFLVCEANGHKVVGSFLFTVGLISVCMFGFNLYTGKIGYVLQNDSHFFADTLLSIVGNAIGCLIFAYMRPSIGNVVKLCESRLDKNPLQVVLDGILCGILIFICVDIYKKKNTIAGILVCIPVFILAGFEHSVADMFYFINARMFSWEVLGFIGLVIVGNAIGGLFIPVVMKLSNKLTGKSES